MDIVGRQIGRYEVLEPIGEGGMAQVYKAYDPEIDRAVALKVLREEHCADPEHTNRFLREGKAAGALTHPNIVTIYDVGSIDDAPYIMMELLPGETLGDLLKDGRKLSPVEITQLGMQLAAALDYAHSQGVVHRDMKPDNVILGHQGGPIKIADFGIARMDEISNKESTQVGMMLGTPRYMSPEQASGAEVDGRSDLFAVGVILYEAITGQKAFDAESMPTLIMQIVQKDPVPIRQISADAPLGLQKIVNKLLQKKPERRFQSGAELGAALERELANLRESEEEQRGYLPLEVKWTAIMAGIVAVAMALASVLVFRAQSGALTQQAIDSGISLGKFIAVQAAIPVLGEDWITLDSLVQDASARETFSYLVVSDHTGVVRSASDNQLVGQDWTPRSTALAQLYQQDGILVSDMGGVFNFSLPVLFRDTVVGQLNLGLDTHALQSALDTTRRMMLILGLSVVLAVSLVIYLFNKLIARNLKLATSALRLFAQGRLETRISRQRSDEFGDLFGSYNGMADALEQRLHREADGGGAGVAPAEGPDLDISGITQGMVDEQTIVKPGEQD